MSGNHKTKEALALSEMPEEELRFRLNLIEEVLRMLNTDSYFQGRKELPKAIAEYERQREVVARELKKRLKPPPVKVGLRQARMGIKTKP